MMRPAETRAPHTKPTGMMTRLLVLLLLLACYVPAQAARSCVVLQYHHVGNKTPALTSVRPEQFNAHLDYLKTHHFTVMPLREVVTALQNKTELPEKCVSLTVDDAYASVYQNAYPAIKERHWPMTVFVNSEAVDKGIATYLTWDADARDVATRGDI